MNFSIRMPGQAITANTTSAATEIDTDTTGQRDRSDICIYNPGPNVVHVLAGGSTAVATTLCMPIAPYTKEIYDKGNSSHLATLAIGSSQSLLVFLGSGV